MNNIVYQIYPKSFADSSGSGVGDIRGIIGKLDYIRELGVDTIWLCPVFCSPMVDNGYDISDYRDIDPMFGTLADLEELIAAARERGIGVLLDLVLNHSSNRHPWFLEAINNPGSKYRDYYIFKKGENGQPPNNWRSNFGGSAWEPDGKTGEYYLHVFAKEQPDLNWENPELREELFSMIRWWLEKGVAGFRIDAICFIKKDLEFPCLPADGPDSLANPGSHWMMHEGIGEFLAEMRDKAFKPYNAYTVAEANGVRPGQLNEYIGENGYFSAVFDFNYTDIDLDSENWHTVHPIDRSQLREAIFKSQLSVSAAGHGAVYLENHDQNRSPNKYLLPEERCFESITMLGALYFFLQGTAFIYQGQELGILNYPWTDLSQFNDVATVDQYHRAVAAGFSESQAMEIVSHRSRDNSRTPMLWSAEKNAGFSAGEPWLPIHPDFLALSAKAEECAPQSVLHFYRRMGALRQKKARLFYDGDFQPRFLEIPSLFAYSRSLEGEAVLVVCNFQNAAIEVTLPKGDILLGNLREGGVSGLTSLKPFEALVLLIGE